MPVITVRCHTAAIDRLQQWSNETGRVLSEWELDPAERNDLPPNVVELTVHHFEAVQMLASEGWLVEGASVEGDGRILFAMSKEQDLVQVKVDKGALSTYHMCGDEEFNNLVDRYWCAEEWTTEQLAKGKR